MSKSEVRTPAEKVYDEAVTAADKAFEASVIANNACDKARTLVLKAYREVLAQEKEVNNDHHG